MKAYEMFFKLGYNLERDDDDYIIYRREFHEGYSKVISFCDQLKNVNISYEGTVIDMMEGTPSICMELFKAIQKQLEELNWL